MNYHVPLLIGTLLLAGCQQTEKAEVEATAEVVTDDYMKHYDGNAQIPDDRTLLKKGDTVQAEKGFMTLKEATFKQQIIHVGDIQLTVYDTKRIHLEPDYSMIDYFHQLTEQTNFDIVKAFVKVENTGKQTLQFSPVATITANGHQQTFERDIYLDRLTGKIEPGEIKYGNIGYIIAKDDKKWTVETSAIYNKKHEQITSPKQFSLQF